MNILLHGAINASNFGDCLFADIFYHQLKKQFPNDNVWFYDNNKFGISDFLRKAIPYSYKMTKEDYENIHLLIYISGGYFGEDKKSLKSSIIRYYRYVKIGERCISNNIPIMVIGLEVGPLHYNFLKERIGNLLEKSWIVTVRNEESLNYCINRLRLKNVILTSDTAIQIKKRVSYENKINKILIKGKKSIFLHVQSTNFDDISYLHKIVLPVLKFCNKHPEYYIIYGCDNVEKSPCNFDFQKGSEFCGVKCIHYFYDNYWELYSLLNCIDLTITTKLHVGIISASLNKPVISTPQHLYKTKRFYKQIGYSANCIPYETLTAEMMTNKLEQLYYQPIRIPKSIVKKSEENINLMLSTIEQIKRQRYSTIS